jgi:hypothetical protein
LLLRYRNLTCVVYPMRPAGALAVLGVMTSNDQSLLNGVAQPISRAVADLINARTVRDDDGVYAVAVGALRGDDARSDVERGLAAGGMVLAALFARLPPCAQSVTVALVAHHWCVEQVVGHEHEQEHEQECGPARAGGWSLEGGAA